ncbi:sulfotransferase [Oleiagrimonas soli]|nr:sulfotransferase [Oleiagrimonas soli]
MTMPTTPAVMDRLNRRADQYLASGQLVAAQTTLESLLQRVPESLPTRLRLIDVLWERGRFRGAAAEALRAASFSPVAPEMLIQIAQRLSRCGETVAARRCLSRLEEQHDLDSAVLVEAARLRLALGEIPEALQSIEKAAAEGLDDPDACYLHASLAQFSGDIEGAGRILEQCLDRWPMFSGASMAQARLRKQEASTNHVESLQAKLGRIPVDSGVAGDRLVRAEFESALFNELDDLGQHAQAWEALASSNAIMHELFPYHREGEEAVTEAIIGRALKPVSKGGAVTSGPVPIFIIGLPRSGTTLLDRMLSNHSGVVSAGEINDFLLQMCWSCDIVERDLASRLDYLKKSAHVDFRELGERYLQQTIWRAREHAFFIDKLPTNFQLVDLIHRALPDARILHMVRDPMDVCFSNLKAMFGGTSTYSYAFGAMAHYHRQYRRIMRHWHETLPGVVMDVDYDALVKRPEVVMPQVLAYCGLDMQVDCLSPERNVAPVSTPSSVQVRQPIHTRSVAQWRHYEQQLQPLLDMLR